MSCRVRLFAPVVALVVALPGFANAQATADSKANAAPAVAASAQVTIQQPPAPSPRAPLPNRVNEVMPTWLRVRAEFRERVEGFESSGFVPERDDSYYLSRFRLNATVTASKLLSFQAQVQDSRVADKSVGPTTAPFRGPFDLRLGFAQLGNAKSPVTMQAGRIELIVDDQRLVGNLPWTNTARSWDGGHVTYTNKAFQLDAFGASLVRSLPGEFDKSGAGNRFAGAYLQTSKVIPGVSLMPFAFWKRDVNLRSESGPLAHLSETTLGGRASGKLPAHLDYAVMMAKQVGSLGADDIDAWAGHYQIRESFPGRLAFKVTSEYNYASGDSDARDGTRATFDQLYPTGHDKLGLSDQVGWRNINHIREGIEFSPIKATPITVNYHSWWLADKADGLYAASGALVTRVAGGARDSHVGQELDFLVNRAITPQLQLQAGYAHVFTGAFLKQATPGASYSYPYVMATYVFLADK